MKPETYSEEFRKTMGKEKALQIAERCYKESMPENWGSLPESPVFHKRNKQNQIFLDEKHLRANNNWWKHVYFILKKK